MRRELFFSIHLVFLFLLVPLKAKADAPYTTNMVGALSPSPSSFVHQWEISSAALRAGTANSVCDPVTHTTGDAQVFLSWVFTSPDGQRVMVCPASDLGTSNCDAAMNAVPSLSAAPFPTCADPAFTGQIYVSESNDNVMSRLRDDRIVQVVQTIKMRCPPSSNDGIDNDGDGVIDEPDQTTDKIDNDGDGLIDESNTNGKDDDGDGDVDEEDETGEGEEVACIYRGGNADREQVSYVVRISGDCGQTWATSVLDADQVQDLNGNLLLPRLKGFDRVEVYADPWSDHLLLTAQAGENPCCCTPETAFLHAYLPSGTSQPVWQQLFKHKPEAVPTVMTSLPHPGGVSRMYWFNCEGHTPTLFVSDNPWTSATGPGTHKLSTGCDQLWSQSGETPIRNLIYSTAIARISTDATTDTDTVRVAYPQTRTVDGAKYQTLRVDDLEVAPDGSGGFAVTSTMNREIDLATTRPAGDRASVFWPSIIQADRTTPKDPHAATHVLRWTEVRDDGMNAEMLASWDPSLITSSGSTDVWNPDEELVRWPCNGSASAPGNCSIGDYQYGAFIDTVDQCTHEFFVPWGVELPGGAIRTHGAILTTTMDRDPPVFDSPPADQAVSCDAVPPAPVLSASDNCDSSPEVQLTSEQRTDGSCQDTYTLTRSWTAVDNVGFEATDTQTIEVEDTAAPVLDTPPPDQTAECDAVPETAMLGATDNCDDNPMVSFQETRIDGSCPSNYHLKRTWNAEDRCGNASGYSAQMIAVQDTTPPDVEPGGQDLYCLWPPNHKYVCFSRDQFNPEITDNCGAEPTWLFAGCASNQPEDANGDGATPEDCKVSPDGQSFCVRAERDGSLLSGRRYAVSIVATDECGNTGTPVVIGNIHVPHNQRAGRMCIQ